jgi:hypothetical protein
MATMTRPAPAGTDPAAGVADVFVIFRITGDLAKVMTSILFTGSRPAGCSTVRSSASPSTTGP